MHKIIMQYTIFSANQINVREFYFCEIPAITAVLLKILVFWNEMLLFVWFPLF